MFAPETFSSSKHEQLSSRLVLARTAATKLVELDIATHVIRSFSSHLTAQGQSVSFVSDDGKVDTNELGKYIGSVKKKDQAVAASLTRLKKYFQLPTPQEKVEELLKCTSAGIMLLTAAACPQMYLSGSEKCSLPPEVLEFDMRGRFEAAGDLGFGYMDIGEIKKTAVYAKAVEQLGIRLQALRWLIVTWGLAAQDEVRLVGRIVLPKAAGASEMVDGQQRELAKDAWGFSLYLHVL